jgi:hypothetical protein
MEVLDPMTFKRSAIVESLNRYGIEHVLKRFVAALRDCDRPNGGAIADDIEEIIFYAQKTDSDSEESSPKFRQIPKGRGVTEQLLEELPY